MYNDPIVDEIHKVRESKTEKLNDNLHEICKYYRNQQNESAVKVVTLPPRNPIQKDVA